MIVSLFGNKRIEVTEEQAAKLDKAITREDPPKFIKIDGQLIKVADISGIYEDGVWETMEHEAKGDWKCINGHWHGVRETYCPVPKPQKLPSWMNPPEATVRKATTEQQKWFKILKINSEAVKNKKPSARVPFIKNLEELAAFESTGKQPDWIDPQEWTATDGWHARVLTKVIEELVA